MAIGTEKAIFLTALECESEAERQAYLREACGDDALLRRRIEELLAVHERSDNVLDVVASSVEKLQNAPSSVPWPASESPAEASVPEWFHNREELVGQTIGNYRLMECIGEGGFGDVYVAEQQQPVRRRVALKLLKAGMNSREVMARFEAERQALARMDHPNIATVFDAGQTLAGRPYFIMELVRGIPITEFCQRRELGPRERLELFISVCQAVQHAHQKGVIHRDIKPSNVLVTLIDGAPVAKVIDFGVAKAISEPLTTRTIYTRFAQLIGTPMYMSPEQAEMSAVDVDTRSDIYSLGVLLYEMLTGVPPFDERRIQTASFDELRRILREEDPPRPSVRLSTLVQNRTTLSAPRLSELRSLASVLGSDLDWIIMKAMDKDRKRRYETAADFARDVRRYLDQQSVLARPPSHWYRFSKFARRNRTVLTTASLVLVTMLIGTAVSTWLAIRATRALGEADRLRQEAVEFADRLKEANVLLDSARAHADERRWSEALAQYTRATQLQPDHFLAWSGRGSLYLRLGLWEQAAADYARAIDLGAPANNPGWWGVPQLCLYTGHQEAYEQVGRTLHQQLSHSHDVAFLTMAARSLSIADHPEVNYTELSELMERLLADRPPEDHFGTWPRMGAPPLQPPPSRPPAGSRHPAPFPEGHGPTPRPGHGPASAGGPFPPRPLGLPRELQHYVTGLALLRAGEYDLACDQLDQADAPGFGPRMIVAPARALAAHFAGRAQAAEEALAEALQVVDDWTGLLVSGGLEAFPLPWFDYLEAQILLREAHLHIRGGPMPIDPRLSEISRQAEELLQSE